jgi:CelD/BcsL family acetyltransferase involved in cellulose biosynthesis
MRTVNIIDPTRDPRWDPFVAGHRYGSVYHTSDWCEVLKKTFSYHPQYLIIEDAGAIVAGMPFMTIDSWITGKRLISLPRTSYCDPLTEHDDELALLLEQAYRLVDDQGLDFFEIKTQRNNGPSNHSELKCYGHFKNQILVLNEGLDKIWDGFHRSSTRKNIKKAQKDAVMIRIADSEHDVKTFYELHKQITKKHMIPPRPYIFFKNIWEVLRPKNTVTVLMAEWEGNSVAAGLFLRSKDSMIFEFTGLNHDYSGHSPVHLITWEAIKVACREGLRYFDFGLTPPDNVGLMQYKERWGTQINSLNYYYYPDVKGYKKFVQHADSSGNHGFRLKDRIKRLVAARLYKHLG